MEGANINSTVRMTGISKPTILKLIVDLGAACKQFHDETVRNVRSRKIQCDEIWAFCYSKKKNVASAKRKDLAHGDIWTWTALDADSKLMVSWIVGGRDSEYAMALMDDLRGRLANRVQLTTDGHKAYLNAVEEAFGADIDYAMLVKLYGESAESQRRYSPADCIGARKIRVAGKPDIEKVSTSYVERSNLTIRMQNRRLTRLTNGFSKKVVNHEHYLAIYFCYYNFVRIHQTIKMTPAMAAGVSTRLWEIGDLVALLP